MDSIQALTRTFLVLPRVHIEGTTRLYKFSSHTNDRHARPTYLLLPRTVSVLFGMQYVSGKCIALITNAHIQNTKFNYYSSVVVESIQKQKDEK